MANPIFDNAIDSLRVGMQFFLDTDHPTSRKHAIRAIFHCIELLLKERLHRIHSALIYKNIDSPISDKSFTVNVNVALHRLANLGVKLATQNHDIISSLQKRRNQIEHHVYEKDDSDFAIVGTSLKFISFFLDKHLDSALKNHIEPDILLAIEKTIHTSEELYRIAEARLEDWLKAAFPGEMEQDWPSFEGTYECPRCSQEFFIIHPEKGRYCFYCDQEIRGGVCGECGESFMISDDICDDICESCLYESHSDCRSDTVIVYPSFRSRE